MQKRYYITPKGYRLSVEKPQTYEHRDVWEAANGPIPPDCHIHHKNENKLDNRLENLECLHISVHLSLHSSSESRIRLLKAARDNLPVRQFVCVKCGASFETKHPTKRFCTKLCSRRFNNGELAKQRTAARAANRGNADCPICGKNFVLSVFGQKYCTRRCMHVAAGRAYCFRQGHEPTPTKYRV